MAIWFFQELFYGKTLNPGNVSFKLVHIPNLFDILSFLGMWRFTLIPSIGGLFVGLIIYLTTSEVEGNGVPKVLKNMLVNNGKINPNISIYKTMASSIAIGSGQSLGREGPIVQIGSAAGSFFGKFTDPKYRRTFVAVGAAGGIAGTFNAPISGILFAIEIILEEYHLKHIIGIVIGSVISTVVVRVLLPFTPTLGIRTFLVPIKFQLTNPLIELPLYLVLGGIVAVSGTLLVKLLYGVEDFFEKIDAPKIIKPGLGVGLLGLSALITAFLVGTSSHQSANWLFGVGYHVIRTVMLGKFSLTLLVALGIMKAIGFSLSVGSGSSGGSFSPSLYIGSMIGGAAGLIFGSIVPGTASPGAYALVGMGGLFAAVANAPLTATVIIFELTGQYTIILPLLLVCVIGSEGARSIASEETIYTEKLRKQGITIQERRHIGSIEDIIAKDVMTTEVDTLKEDDDIIDAVELFQNSPHNGFPIVDEDNKVVGIVTLGDFQDYLGKCIKAIDEIGFSKEDKKKKIIDIATCPALKASPEDNLLTIVDKMEGKDIGRVPIVDKDGKLLGIVTRSDVLDVYDKTPIEFK